MAPSVSLEISGSDVQQEVLPVLPGSTVIGRAPNSTILLNHPMVSRRHAEIRCDVSGAQIADMGSANGTWVNSEALEVKEWHALNPGDLVQIGPFSLTVKSTEPVSGPPTEFMTEFITTGTVFVSPRHGPVLRIRMPDGTSRDEALTAPAYTIGRSPENDIVIYDRAVSRTHARLERRGETYEIVDVDSTNGLLLAGEKVTHRLLAPGDTINLGEAVEIEFRTTDMVDAGPEDTEEARELTLTAVNLQRVVGNGRVILNDVSFELDAREFVAIVGPSGAGKSTLMTALCGYQRASSGNVLINGTDFYSNVDAFRNDIGFVPQDDIIHRELSVVRALNYAARLRMPEGTDDFERESRIYEVIDELGLSEETHNSVSRLSGGQRKRVSIGVELLTRPGLLFLDEATSGLDPNIESQMMRLFRRLADNGRIVVLVTHATKNVMVCDKVIFMARGGYLAFFGPPEEALTYFGATEFDEIYEALEGKSGQEWADMFLAYSQNSRKGESTQPDSGLGFVSGSAFEPELPRPALKQYLTLTARSMEILFRSKKDVAILFALAPFLGSLNFVVWKRDTFSYQTGIASDAVVLPFMLIIMTLLVGSLGSVREIVKEQAIYKRERMVSLQVLPYVMSKVTIGFFFALYSAIMLFLLQIVAVDFSYLTNTEVLQLFVPTFLATMGGVTLGLLVSVISPSEERAMLLIIAVIIPQFLLSGGLLPLNVPGIAGDIVTAPITAKWGYASLITTAKVKYGDCSLPSETNPTDLSDCHIPGMLGKETIEQKVALVESLDIYEGIFDVNIYEYWAAMVILISVVLALVIFIQKRKDTV